MIKDDKWYVQVVGPTGRITYVTEAWKETEHKHRAKSYDNPEDAEDAVTLYQEMCRGQVVLIQVVPLIEED